MEQWSSVNMCSSSRSRRDDFPARVAIPARVALAAFVMSSEGRYIAAPPTLHLSSQIAYGSKEWKAAQRTLRQEAAAAEAALLAAEHSEATHSGAQKMNGKGSGDGNAKNGRGRDGSGGGSKGFAGRAATTVGGKLSKLNLSFKASTKKLF